MHWHRLMDKHQTYAWPLTLPWSKEQHWWVWVFSSLLPYQHFHLFKAKALRVGLPFESFIGPFTPLILAQKDFFLLPPPGCGALRLEPVSRLYLSRPFFVSPPFRDLWTPIFSETDFLLFLAAFFAISHFLAHFLGCLLGCCHSFGSITKFHFSYTWHD